MDFDKAPLHRLKQEVRAAADWIKGGLAARSWDIRWLVEAHKNLPRSSSAAQTMRDPIAITFANSHV